MKKVLYICLLVLAVQGWRDWSQREIVHEPGLLVADNPIQSDLTAGETFVVDGFLLTRRAGFKLRARVLSREDYWLGEQSDLSPLDLALGWGVMSDQAVLDRITISQSSRWYFTRYDYPAPISDQEIINHSSNMHIIPADKRIRRKMKEVRRGDVVMLKGYLVDVDASSGFYWRTSMRRDDTGNGSCEIFYLTYAYIE